MTSPNEIPAVAAYPRSGNAAEKNSSRMPTPDGDRGRSPRRLAIAMSEATSKSDRSRCRARAMSHPWT
jgi:hypothetical protein